MKRFFLLRLTHDLDDYKTISLDSEYLGGEAAIAAENDLFIAYLKGSLEVKGVFVLQNNILTRLAESEKTIRDVYDCLSFIQTIDQNTSRAFKKKTREVSKDDFLKCVAKLILPLHQNHIVTLL